MQALLLAGCQLRPDSAVATARAAACPGHLLLSSRQSMPQPRKPFHYCTGNADSMRRRSQVNISGREACIRLPASAGWASGGGGGASGSGGGSGGCSSCSCCCCCWCHGWGPDWPCRGGWSAWYSCMGCWGSPMGIWGSPMPVPQTGWTGGGAAPAADIGQHRAKRTARHTVLDEVDNKKRHTDEASRDTITNCNKLRRHSIHIRKTPFLQHM